MKIELHLHTNRYSSCGRNTPEEMMTRLQEEGFGIVFLTEHDAVWPDEELAELQARFPAIRIFPGIERTLEEEGMHHLLLLGTNDPAYLSMLDESQILSMAQSNGHLTVLAHPLRRMAGAPMLQAGHLPDAVEYLTRNHDSYRAWTISRMAASLGLRLLNADDAHDVQSIGRYWIESDRAVQGPEDVRRLVLDGDYELRWPSR